MRVIQIKFQLCHKCKKNMILQSTNKLLCESCIKYQLDNLEAIKEFPKIGRDNWKSVKIKSTEHAKIISLNKQGHSIWDISKLYNVSFTCIRRIIEPEYAKKQGLYGAKYYREQLKKDTPAYKKYKKQHSERTKERSSEPEMKIWKKVTDRIKYRKTRIEKDE